MLFFLALGLGLSSQFQKQARLAFLGDVMLGRGVSAAQVQFGWQTPLGLLAEDLNGADLALANLESPLTELPLSDPAGYDLRADPSAVSSLAVSGLDVLSLANNHSLDSGPQGLAETRSALGASSLKGVAAGDPPLRLQAGRLELAILAYEAVSQPLDWTRVAAEIRRAKRQGAVVIVSLHWGGEFRPAADPAQRDAARILSQAGADLIWGHHPHVLQPVEWLERPKPFHPTLVIYSLGNALFDQHAPPDAAWGALLVASLDAFGVTGVEVRPFKIDLQAGGLIEADPLTDIRIRERLQLQ